MRWNGAASISRHVIANNAVLTSIDLGSNGIDARAAPILAKVVIVIDIVFVVLKLQKATQ